MAQKGDVELAMRANCHKEVGICFALDSFLRGETFFFFFDMFTQRNGEKGGIRTNDFRFIKRGPSQLIELLIGD